VSGYEPFEDALHRRESARLGMWLFLVTEILFFSGLFVAYVVSRSHHPEIFDYGQRYLSTTLGATGAVLMIAASVTAAFAVRAARIHQQQRLVASLGIGFLLAIAFLGVRAVEWAQRANEGTLWGVRFDPCESPDGKELPCLAKLELEPQNTAAVADEKKAESAADDKAESAADDKAEPAADGKKAAAEAEAAHDRLLALAKAKRKSLPPEQVPPANTGVFFAIYFAMTGLHALQVLFIPFVLLWLLRRARKHEFRARYYGPIDCTGLYVHFLTVLSLFIFGLLYLVH